MGKETDQRDRSTQRGDGSYSFISVDAAPEEDVFVVNAEGVFRVDPDDETSRPRLSDDAVDADSDAEADSDNDQPSADASSGGPECKDDPSPEVHEQTLADLEGSGPLPAMHRAIIAIVVLAVIAAVAWYFLK